MSIADKLTYLQTTKQLLKTEINKIKNVLDDNSTFRSYPQELFNGYLDILNNGTDTLWNNLEKVSASGETPVLENVETAPVKMVLNGNTSQDGTPTPDTPVEVKVVTGENVVSVQGKNKIDLTKHTNTLASNTTILNSNTYQCEVTASWQGKIIVPLDLKNNSTYTISASNDSTATRSIIDKIYGYNGATSTTIVTSQYFDYFKNGYRFNSGEYERYEMIIYITGNSSQTGLLLLKDLMIEQSSTATPYVPYSKTDYPINLGDIELCKINTYKDYFHKDSGKWYVHKEIGKKVFDGSETWRKDTGYFNCNASLGGIVGQGYTNYYKYGSLGTLNNFVITTNAFRVNADFETLEDYKNWLSTHNVILYYVLATPTEEEITNSTLIEQLEAISKAKSVKDKTYIIQTNDELPFILDVEAIKEYSVE